MWKFKNITLINYYVAETLSLSWNYKKNILS